MNSKWMVKLGAPILALALVSACSAPNNQNEDTPQDTNSPRDESPNDEDMRHNDNDQNMDESDDERDDEQREDPGNKPPNDSKYDNLLNEDKSHTTQ